MIKLKISDYFKELKSKNFDFYDVYIGTDTWGFIDPYEIYKGKDVFSITCQMVLDAFFSKLFEFLRQNNIAEAMKLFKEVKGEKGECFEISFGFTRIGRDGTGLSDEMIEHLIKAILKSGIYKNDLFANVVDLEIFIKGVGADRVSDITAKILKNQLLIYTLGQCKKHDLPTDYFDSDTLFIVDFVRKDEKEYYSWNQASQKRLMLSIPNIDNNYFSKKEDIPIILTPKRFIKNKSNSNAFSRFWSRGIIKYLQDGKTLVFKGHNIKYEYHQDPDSNSTKTLPTKKELFKFLKDNSIDITKENAAEFAIENDSILKEFKRNEFGVKKE